MTTSNTAGPATATTSSSDYDFSRILQQSKELNARICGARNIPMMYRGLEQVETSLTKLAAKAGIFAADLNSSVNLNLNGNGFSRISFAPASIDPTQAITDTDVEGYLQHQYEKKIMESVERVHRETSARIDEMVNLRLTEEWERRKKKFLLEGHVSNASNDSGVVKAVKELSVIESLSGPKLRAYGNVIKRLNDARLKKNGFALCKAFAAEIKGLESDNRGDQILACWDALASIEGEDPTGKSSSSMKGKISADRLVQGSRKFLEEAFVKFVDGTVAQYPRDALLGGKPSPVDRIRAFLNIKLKRMSTEEMERIELINGSPIWAFLFYLFRCGYLNEAYNFAVDNSTLLEQRDPAFLAYLKAFVETEDRSLTGKLRGQLQSDYSQRMMLAGGGSGNFCQDPFKMALLKIMGRCDLGRKTVGDVIQTTEDYMWLQMWLVKEVAETGNTNNSLFSSTTTNTTTTANTTGTYNLNDLQKLVQELGPSYFNPKGTNPLQYFEILLLTGLFEEAIGYLASTSHQLDALHFAISLVYYGSVELSTSPDNLNDWQLVSRVKDRINSNSSVSVLNFYRVIQQVCKAFPVQDVPDILHYLMLLPLGGQTVYTRLCKEAVRDAVLAGGNFSTILGDVTPEGFYKPGYLSELSPLINDNDGDFVDSIIGAAAGKSESEDHFSDALLLYNLARDYNRVLSLLNRRLSQAFSLAYDASANALLLQQTAGIFGFYEQSQQIVDVIDRGLLETGKILMGLVEGKRLYAEARWSEALVKFESLRILPLEGSLQVTDLASLATNLSSLPDTLSSLLSDLLLLLMTCIYQLFASARQLVAVDPGRRREIEVLRGKGRAVMILVGLLQYRVAPDTCAKLAHMDIYMN